MLIPRISKLFWIILLNVILIEAFTSGSKSAGHPIFRRNVNNTSDTSSGDDSSSACGKTCVIAVVSSVLAVFLLCLVGSIYYASNQDKGESKLQNHWKRTMLQAKRNMGNTQRQPVSLRQMDDNLNQLGSLGPSTYPALSTENVAHFVMDGNPYTNEEYAYENESYYNDSVYQEKVRNLYNKNGWNPRDNNDAERINKNRKTFEDPGYYSTSAPSSRGRMFSAPDMYFHEQPHPLPPRPYSFDQGRLGPYQDDFGYDQYGDDDGYSDPIQTMRGAFFGPEDGQFTRDGYYPSENNTAPQTDHMGRKAVPHRPVRHLKSALKHAKSLQKIPVESDEEDVPNNEQNFRIISIKRGSYKRSRSLDDLSTVPVQDGKENNDYEDDFAQTYLTKNNAIQIQKRASGGSDGDEETDEYAESEDYYDQGDDEGTVVCISRDNQEINDPSGDIRLTNARTDRSTEQRHFDIPVIKPRKSRDKFAEANNNIASNVTNGHVK